MRKRTYVLGVSMSNHDRAACLLADGRVVAAVAEERLDRRKHSEGFYRHAGRQIVLPPVRAITRLLRDESIGLDDLDLVVCGRSITLCRDGLLDHLPVSPERVVEPPLPGHHLAHAYSAYATAPFSEMAVLVIDEQGHWDGDRFERCSWFAGEGGPLRSLERFWGRTWSLSLGMFYNAFAALTGLAEAGRPAAGKLMSLAAFGHSRPDWPKLLTLDPNGDAFCDLSRLDDFLTLAGVPNLVTGEFVVRNLDELLAKYEPVHWTTPLAADLAHKAQHELEAAVLHTATQLHHRSGLDRLAYAGGVALNCTADARLSEAGWRDAHVHPAATDDGTAFGLAMYGWTEVLGRRRPNPGVFIPLLGPRHPPSVVVDAFTEYGLSPYAQRSGDRVVAELVASGAVVCRCAGRSEWGPRALGARSIVANPLTPGITERINAVIKFREAFRPFGVSLPAEVADELLDRGSNLKGLDGYMLNVAVPCHPALRRLAHTDGTLRYQLVDSTLQPDWYELIQSIGKLTGLPAVVNTSFNTLGEPLVESPSDALRQFLLSGADALSLEGSLVVAGTVPEEVLQNAREHAWGRSLLDALNTAASLEATGYAESARKVLDDHGVSARDALGRGPESVRLYHGLCQRLAVSGADSEAARSHAVAVLQRWMFPAEVFAAGVLLGDRAPDSIEDMLGLLLATRGRDRSAAQFFSAVLGPAVSRLTGSAIRS